MKRILFMDLMRDFDFKSLLYYVESYKDTRGGRNERNKEYYFKKVIKKPQDHG